MTADAATFTETILVEPEQPAQSLLHLVCEHTVDWSLCGKDVTSEPWGKQPDEEDCAACDEFDDANFCAHCAMGDGS